MSVETRNSNKQTPLEVFGVKHTPVLFGTFCNFYTFIPMNKENVRRLENLSVVSLAPSKTFHKQDASGNVSNIVVATYSVSSDDDISFVNDGGVFHGNLRVPEKYFKLADGTVVDANVAFETWKKNATSKLTRGTDNYVHVFGFVVPIVELTNGKYVAVENLTNGRQMRAFRIASPNNNVDAAIEIARANLQRATKGATPTHKLVANPDAA